MKREEFEPRASLPVTERNPSVPYDSCGVSHDGCPNTWKGSCDREPGHSGSHHCGSCNSLF